MNYSVLIFFVLLLVPAVWAEPDPKGYVLCDSCESCSKALSSDGAKVRLAKDIIVGDDDTISITISASNTVLDCIGPDNSSHYISGKDGIALHIGENVRGAKVTNCEIRESEIGLYFNPDSQDNTFEGGKFYDTRCAVEFKGGGNTVSGSKFEGCGEYRHYGEKVATIPVFRFEETGEFSIIGNEIRDSNGAVFFLKGPDADIIIKGNEFYNNPLILFIGGGEGIDLSGNLWDKKGCLDFFHFWSMQDIATVKINPMTDGNCIKEVPKLSVKSNGRAIFGHLRDSHDRPIIGASIVISIGRHALRRTTNEWGYFFQDINYGEFMEDLEDLRIEFRGSDYIEEVSVGFEDILFDGERELGCERIYSGKSQGNKLRIAFVVPNAMGDKSKDAIKKELINKYIDEAGKGFGMGSVEPFRSHLDKFEFYLLVDNYNTVKWMPEGRGVRVDNVELFEKACGSDKVVFLIPEEIRAAVIYGKTIDLLVTTVHLQKYATIRGGGEHNDKLFVHELGHLIGDLRDEYIEEERGSRPDYPNCARTRQEAQEWWGEYWNRGLGEFRVSFYTGNKDAEGVVYSPLGGCSYVADNIRPTLNSIMNHHAKIEKSDWLHAFGPVNEAHLEKILSRI